jgi:choline dehydrogenase
VLANRLSADPSIRVLLLEAGPRDWNPFIHMPAGLAKLVLFKSMNWNYNTEPEPALNNRRLYWPRGKVLGGSSSINAMCYSAAIAATTTTGPRWAIRAGAGPRCCPTSALRGPGARRIRTARRRRPLSVSDLSYTNPLSDVFIQAAEQAGFARNRDFNGPDPARLRPVPGHPA